MIRDRFGARDVEAVGRARPEPTAAPGVDPAPPVGHVRLLQGVWITSAFDRFVVGPMLLTIALDFHASLAATAGVASWYFFCYGLSQPLWGRCLDRFGRVRTMRVTLAAAALAGIVSAGAPNLTVLIVARGCMGALIGAVIPAGMVYVGDVVPFRERQRTLTDLNAALAAGIAVAIAAGGVLASELSWRIAFLLPAVSALVLTLLLSRLPEPRRDGAEGQGYRTVLRYRWSYLILTFALIEGAALLGCLPYLAPALENWGASPSVAGSIVALYGIGLMVASMVVKRLARRLQAWVFLAVGACGVTVGCTLGAVVQNPWSLGAAALLLGVAWAPMNSTMQAWATEAVPEARAAMVSMFVASVFAGSGLGTAALGPLAAAGRWSQLFLVGVLLAVVFAVSAPLARARFHPRRAAEGRVP